VAAASRCAGVPKLGEVGEQSGQKAESEQRWRGWAWAVRCHPGAPTSRERATCLAPDQGPGTAACL